MSDNPVLPPPGYYDDGSGQQRYWDGQRWADVAAAPTQPLPGAQQATAQQTLAYSTAQQPDGGLTQGGSGGLAPSGDGQQPQPGSTAVPSGATVPVAPVAKKSGLGTWALVLGIIGAVFAFIPHTSGFGIFLGVVALVLGVVGLLRKGTRALAGTVLGGAAVFFGIIFAVIYGVALSGASVPVADQAAHASSAAASKSTADAAAPAKKTAPSTKPSPSKAAAPAGTAAQLQALVAAKTYLSDGQGFSQAGLLSQLTSQYGNGFAQADAQWAIDHAGADWNAQALAAAKGYLSDGQGFSQAGLIQQLTSSSGNQFTQDQAQYGVDNAGADWNAQAVMAAKGYMSSGMGFSRDSLIQQLTSAYGNQFTEDQAEYAAGQVGL
jgi:hypothetical protein